jgi:hypothetical protein
MALTQEALIEEARKAVADWTGDIFDESDYLLRSMVALLDRLDALEWVALTAKRCVNDNDAPHEEYQLRRWTAMMEALRDLDGGVTHG